MEAQASNFIFKIRRQSRSDGPHFWHWEIFDHRKWRVAEGKGFPRKRRGRGETSDWEFTNALRRGAHAISLGLTLFHEQCPIA
jgi:hypothetical protein